MSESFTPGPWVWYGPSRTGITFDHEAHVGPGEGNDVCGPIAAVSGDDDEQAVANARLISAAPDLLAFAEDVANNYDHEECYHRAGNARLLCRCCKAEAVIAKARGED